MALKDIVIPTVEVAVAGGGFAVRGLSANDLETLLATHGTDVKLLWDEFLKDDTDLTKLEVGQMMPLIKKVVAKIPRAVADIISLATDADDEDEAIIRKLSIGTQASAIGAILSQTLGTDGDWAKTMETIVNLIGGANGALTELAKGKLNP